MQNGVIVLEWIVLENGSIGMKQGELLLESGFPSFDYKQIKASKVDVLWEKEKIVIQYYLDNIQIELTAWEDNGICVLDTKLSGNTILPRMFYPLSGLIVQGADRFFKQGFGFGGPSGIVAIDDNAQIESHESYLTTAFFDKIIAHWYLAQLSIDTFSIETLFILVLIKMA